MKEFFKKHKSLLAIIMAGVFAVGAFPMGMYAESARQANIKSKGVFEYQEEGGTKVRIDSDDLRYVAGEIDTVETEINNISNSSGTGKLDNLEDAVSDIIGSGKGNATASDLLTGKTAWVNGSLITGSIPNNGALSKSFTPSTSSQSYTLPAGYYSGGTVSVTSIPNQRSASNKSLTYQNESVTYNAGYYPSAWTVTATYSGSTTHSSTYTVPSSSASSYSSINLGASHSYRYVDATAIYNYGYNQGYNDAPTPDPITIVKNNDVVKYFAPNASAKKSYGNTVTVSISGFDVINGVVVCVRYDSGSAHVYYFNGEGTCYLDNKMASTATSANVTTTNDGTDSNCVPTISTSSIQIQNSNASHNFTVVSVTVFGCKF